MKDRWYEEENHYALFVVTVVSCIHVLFVAGEDKRRISMVQEYSNVCFTHCGNMLEEAKINHFNPREIWSQIDPLAEVDIMAERLRLMGDMVAAYILAQPKGAQLDNSLAIDILRSSYLHNETWGLGVIPSMIGRYWALCRVDASSVSELALGQLLASVCAGNCGRIEGVKAFDGPYYDFMDVWAKKNDILFVANDQIREDNPTSFLWFGRAIMFILAKRNYKSSCKRIWPTFSHCIHQEPNLSWEKFFETELCKEGEIEQYTYRAENWLDLLRAATDDSRALFLEPYSEFAWLIAAYVAIVPYRAWTGVIMWLDTELNDTFYNKLFLPT